MRLSWPPWTVHGPGPVSFWRVIPSRPELVTTESAIVAPAPPITAIPSECARSTVTWRRTTPPSVGGVATSMPRSRAERQAMPCTVTLPRVTSMHSPPVWSAPTEVVIVTAAPALGSSVRLGSSRTTSP